VYSYHATILAVMWIISQSRRGKILMALNSQLPVGQLESYAMCYLVKRLAIDVPGIECKQEIVIS